jgi:hypothetical protein
MGVMMTTIAEYIVKKFNQEAASVDKVKVTIMTMFDTAITTILTVQGLVSFLNITNKWLPMILVAFFAMRYFPLFRLWHITRIVVGINPEDVKRSKNGK